MADCCCYESQPESGIINRRVDCNFDECVDTPTNRCGLTHPKGSGTIAGCNSTTLPHFGVILGERDGSCRPLGYYTSGNTTEYEDICGNMGELSCTEIVEPCVTRYEYEYEECDPCTGDTTNPCNCDVIDSRLTAVEQKNDEQDVDIASKPDKAVDHHELVGSTFHAIYTDGSDEELIGNAGVVYTQDQVDDIYDNL